MYEYHKLLNHILKHGDGHDDRTGTGTTSIFGYQMRHCLSDGFPILTTKKVSLRWVAEELFWFLSGSTNNNDLLDRGVDIWSEWAKEDGDLGPIYGKQWRSWNGYLDQIKQVVTQIQKEPNSRRIICSAWNADQIQDMSLPPCHSMFQIKVHAEGTMDLHMYMRSCDAFLGLPYNLSSYALLLQLLAHVTGYVPRDLIISFGDLHIYNNHIDQVRLQVTRIPRKLPTVALNQDLANGGLEALLKASWSDITLMGYDPYPAIKGEISV